MKLVTTSVVRGSRRGESHGGAFLVDLDAREIRQILDWKRPGAHDRERGLRGLACDGEIIYVAASDELLAFTPDFRQVGAWRNPYLKDCQEVAAWERRLFLVAAGCDSIIGFDLDRREFDWGLQVVTQQYRFLGRAFDPRGDDGPLLLAKLHLDSVHCTRGGMYIGGGKTGGMLLFNGRELRMAVELPPGARNARPFRNGVLFNDTEAGVLRYSGRDGAEDRAFRVPEYPAESLREPEPAHGAAGKPLACGLAVISDALVAGGSSPATLSVYDLPRNERALSVALTMDARHAVHSIATWPY